MNQNNWYYQLERKPEINDVVVGTVVEIKETEGFIKLKLPAYANQEAYMLISNLYRGTKKARSISQYARVGETFPVAITSVTNVIDVSKKELKPEETKNVTKEHYKLQRVVNILTRVSADQSLLDIAWTLEDPLSWLKYHQSLPGINKETEIGVKIEKYCKQQLRQEQVKLLCIVDLETFSYEGIDDIKSCLKRATNQGVKVEYTGNGLYSLCLKTNDIEQGKTKLENVALDVIGKLKEMKGKGFIKQKPTLLIDE